MYKELNTPERVSLLARRVPGVSSLIRVGKAVNRALPDLEVAAETRIKEFIQAHLDKAYHNLGLTLWQ